MTQQPHNDWIFFPEAAASFGQVYLQALILFVEIFIGLQLGSLQEHFDASVLRIANLLPQANDLGLGRKSITLNRS